MKLIIHLVKMYPIAVTFVMAINLILALSHISIVNMTYPIFGHSLMVDVIMLLFSQKLKFCTWHRLLLINMIFAIMMEWIWVNFNIISSGIFYVHLLLTITCITILTAAISFYKYGIFEVTSCKGNRNDR